MYRLFAYIQVIVMGNAGEICHTSSVWGLVGWKKMEMWHGLKSSRSGYSEWCCRLSGYVQYKCGSVKDLLRLVSDQLPRSPNKSLAWLNIPHLHPGRVFPIDRCLHLWREGLRELGGVDAIFYSGWFLLLGCRDDIFLVTKKKGSSWRNMKLPQNCMPPMQTCLSNQGVLELLHQSMQDQHAEPDVNLKGTKRLSKRNYDLQ